MARTNLPAILIAVTVLYMGMISYMSTMANDCFATTATSLVAQQSPSRAALPHPSLQPPQQHDPDRLCTQNKYASSLSLNLTHYAQLADEWLGRETQIEKQLLFDTLDGKRNHKRFRAFEEMGSCEKHCLGGECRSDSSKITCGSLLQAPCVVYSIGGNNEWFFEKDVLSKTPCEVHTFDCTGPRSRFTVPDHSRLHFHHVCIGITNHAAKTAAELKRENKYSTGVVGAMWTLQKMQSTLNHSQVDLFKMDVEGYEWEILHSWPELRDIDSPRAVLPMQLLVEFHYRTQMESLAVQGSPEYSQYDFKYATDMVRMQSHLLKMGYVTVVRDDNPHCLHCTELTLVRTKCPATALV